jgi:hypothetical protein
MNLSRDEALEALGAIHEADSRVRTVRRYAEFADYVFVWGTVWLVANVVSDFDSRLGGFTWLAGLAVGTALTLYFTVRNVKLWKSRWPDAVEEGRAIGRRASLLGFTLMAWFPALLLVAGPLTPRQTNAMISLVWAFVYMATGAFTGWRIFAIGAVTAIAVLVGYVFLTSHYQLWMGLVGGGSLILGGLWLRRA